MSVSRREILISGTVGVVAAAAGGAAGWTLHKSEASRREGTANSSPIIVKAPPPPPIARCAPLVYPEKQWWWTELNNFVEYLPADATVGLETSVDVLPHDATIANLSPTHSQDVYKFLSQFDYVSSSTWEYMTEEDSYEGMWEIDYHNRVKWLCKKMGLPIMENASTFELEQTICKEAFARIWDKLTPAQRMALLQKIDPKDQISGKAQIAEMAGATALAALSATVYFTGFAFYTTMSIAMSSAAGLLGLTLPFAAYTGASTVVELLSGPWGWTVAGILAGASAISWIGSKVKASPQKTLPAVLQLHGLKVAALSAAGLAMPS
jgi:uncharacterized protein YaaW (UPF0174 family)